MNLSSWLKYLKKILFFNKDERQSTQSTIHRNENTQGAYIGTTCGHSTPLKGFITAGDESIEIQLTLNDSEGVAYCITCLEKMSIICAWCKKPILIGDPITLNSPTHTFFRVPKNAVIYSTSPKRLVGCLRQTCSYGIDRAGFWMPPGVVARVQTPLEMLMNSETPSMVFVSDLSDPNNIGTRTPLKE